MTGCMYLYGWVFKQQTQVIHLLGNILTGCNSQEISLSQFATGVLAHYGVGFFFTLTYYSLENDGFLTWLLAPAIITGIISGILATVVWMGYIRIHQSPPRVHPIHYSLALLLAHVVFASVIFSYMNGKFLLI